MNEHGKERTYHIGCQSWQYDDWITQPVGETVFYPRGTRTPDMLELYSQIFDTIEVDSTAYGTPAATTIEGWLDTVPESFLFSLKVPRAVTHEFSLDWRGHTLFDEFVEASRTFGPRLGVVLIQLPAAFESTKDNAQNLRSFLGRLPRDVRFAIEFRHPGWFLDWTFEELNERGVALALVAGKWVAEEIMFAAFDKVRTSFAYLRFMGIRDLEKFDRIQRDRTDEILGWVDRFGSLPAHEVFVYLDNYFEGHAPATANKLKSMVGVEMVDPVVLDVQGSLF
ncbi:MAG TPA: DUF72 domain-containing protein [Pyrinomonadaceae bacterium]|nr:DUF72 domain-containing protein [Pyrinomonadaceae bacterium]